VVTALQNSALICHFFISLRFSSLFHSFFPSTVKDGYGATEERRHRQCVSPGGRMRNHELGIGQ
jgi:hypothetical protein